LLIAGDNEFSLSPAFILPKQKAHYQRCACFLWHVTQPPVIQFFAAAIKKIPILPISIFLFVQPVL